MMGECLLNSRSDLRRCLDSGSRYPHGPGHVIKAQDGPGQIETQGKVMLWNLSLVPVGLDVELQQSVRAVITDHKFGIDVVASC